MFKLIALDLSTTSTGFAIFENEELRESGTIAPKNKDWKERVKIIYREILNMLGNEYNLSNAVTIVAETPLSLQNGDTTIKLAKLHGLILSLSFDFGFNLYEIDNQTWKKHIAGAKATKQQTQYFIEKTTGIKTETTDESDAIGVGMGWMAEERLKGLISFAKRIAKKRGRKAA